MTRNEGCTKEKRGEGWVKKEQKIKRSRWKSWWDDEEN